MMVVRHAGRRTGDVRAAVCHPGRQGVAGEGGPVQFLVPEHRSGVDGVRHLLPLGVLQLYHSVIPGYFEARSLGYITNPNNVLLSVAADAGDLVFIIGGILPFMYIAWIAVRNFWSDSSTEELPASPLYTELTSAARTARREPTRCSLAGGGLRPAPAGCGMGFRRLARRTSNRAADWQQTGGFTYHADHDAWQCPKDEWLWPTSFDPASRVMRYRAPGGVQHLPGEADCTSSPHGREISRHVDPGRTPKRAGSPQDRLSSRLWRS